MDKRQNIPLMEKIKKIGKPFLGKKEKEPVSQPEPKDKIIYMEYAEVKKKSRKYRKECTRKLSFNVGGNIEFQKERIPETRAADLYYETCSRSGKYRFSYPLIIQNPYGLVPLSALMVFQTKEPSRIRYTVKGKTAGTDYINEGTKLCTNHRVPVLGLYAGMENRVVLERMDENGNVLEEKEFTIVTPQLPERLRNSVVKKKETTETALPFKFVFGGDTRYPYAFDSEGEIRYFLKRTPKPYGLFLLQNGHFLFSEKEVLMPSFSNPHAVRNLEMDYLGRMHRIYRVENGIHHDICERENGNFIAAYSTLLDGNEDALAEIDRETGEIVKMLSFSEILDETYQTTKDWAHVNSVCYQPETHTVIACLRNVHSVLKIDWETGKLLWILCHPDFWKETPMQSKVLLPLEGMEWSYQAHAAKLLGQTDAAGNPLLMLYDNHWHKRRPVSFFDGDENSYVRIYAIDEKKKTVSLWKKYACDKSKIRSNGLLEAQRVFAMSGFLEPEQEGFQGQVNEYDMESGALLNQYMTKYSFYRAYDFAPDYDVLSCQMETTSDYQLGTYRKPQIAKEHLPDFTEAVPVQKKETTGQGVYFKGTKKERKKQWKKYLEMEKEQKDIDISNIRFTIAEDCMYVEAVDHLVQKIYFVGNHVVYQADYTDTVQGMPELFGRMVYQLAVPFSHFVPEAYHIFLVCDDTLYESGKYMVLDGE